MQHFPRKNYVLSGEHFLFLTSWLMDAPEELLSLSLCLSNSVAAAALLGLPYSTEESEYKKKRVGRSECWGKSKYPIDS